MNTQLHVTILGYCDKTPREIQQLFLAHGASPLRGLDGEYVIVIRGPQDAVWLVGGPEGYVQYFYSLENERFAHGPTVLDAFAQSNLSWHFDLTTLSDIALLEAPLGNRTLHPRINRLGPREVVHYDGQKLTIERLSFEQAHPVEPVSPEVTVRLFNDAVQRCVAEVNVLPISAGFDSRAILSSCLAQGIRPNLLVCGYPESTDVRAAEQLSKLTGLSLERVELCARDYLEHGQHVSHLTSGAKSAAHWHTYHYVHKCTQDRNANLLVGTNGEWVRTHSLPLGIIAKACDQLPPSVFHRVYWRLKQSNPFTRLKHWLTPEFEAHLNDTAERVRRLESYCPGTVLDGLDRYYLEQRVRNFHSSGYKMYAANFANTRMPMMDRRWIAATQGLPRELRLGSNWHRLAIHTNAPELLEVPVGAIRGNVPTKAPPLEWVSKGLARPVGYTRYGEWFGSREVRDFIVANVDKLAPLYQPDQVAKDVKQRKSKLPIGLLLAFIFFNHALDATLERRSGQASGRNSNI